MGGIMIEPQFTFVILHYIDYKTTVECVESIINNIAYDNYKIVIVDNASPNESGLRLEEKFGTLDKIEVFANGNNAGYRYAKEKFNANYIICINNDTLITQSDFLQRIIEIYCQYKCDVLGPNIISKEGIAQSPRRSHRLTKREVNKHNIKKR